MVAHLDARRFPRASAYLDALGGDLRAHPSCQAVGEMYLDVRKSYPELVKDASLSPELAAQLNMPWKEGEWMSEVAGVVLFTMVRDAVFKDDESFLAWNYKRLGAIYRKPLYRALMLVMSPTLVLIGAANRWAAFHRGSTLRIEQEGGERVGVLSYPQHLFSEPFLHSLRTAFQAGFDAAGAKNSRVTLASHSPTEARFLAKWD